MALNAPSDPRQTGRNPGRRLLDNLWFAASSPQTTIALAVLLAFTFALAASIPQLPGGLDSESSARWLSTTTARYGRFGPFLSSSGLFNLLAGTWLAVLLAATAFHLILRIANQARHLARPESAAIPSVPQGLPFELIHTAAGFVDVQPHVSTTLAGLNPRVQLQVDGDALRPRAQAFAARRPWADVGPLLTYAGALIMLGGLFWNSVEGWRAVELALTPGTTTQPAQASGVTLSLVDAGGADAERPAVLTITRGGVTRNFFVGRGWPAWWGDLWIAQRAGGPALSVGATEGGRPLRLQSLQPEGEMGELLHLRFGQNESEQGFSVPDRNLAFRVVRYESLPDQALAGPVFLIEGYQGNDTVPQVNELIEQGGTVAWQGVTLSLQPDRYVVVDLAAIPGLPLLLAGSLVLLIGVAIIAWAGATRAWINTAADRHGAMVAVRVAAPAAGQDEVSRIAKAIATLSDVDPVASDDGALERREAHRVP